MRVLKAIAWAVFAVALVWSLTNLITHADEFQQYTREQACAASRTRTCPTTTAP